MTQILQNLYIGSYMEASDKKWLKQHKITHIVNTSIEHPNYFPKEFIYLGLNLYDSIHQSLYNVLEPSYRFIDNAIRRGGTVFVHCHAGISRSSSIVIYYLMIKYRWSYPRTYNYVRSLRRIIEPNVSFEKQLRIVSPKSELYGDFIVLP